MINQKCTNSLNNNNKFEKTARACERACVRICYIPKAITHPNIRATCMYIAHITIYTNKVIKYPHTSVMEVSHGALIALLERGAFYRRSLHWKCNIHKCEDCPMKKSRNRTHQKCWDWVTVFHSQTHTHNTLYTNVYVCYAIKLSPTIFLVDSFLWPGQHLICSANASTMRYSHEKFCDVDT